MVLYVSNGVNSRKSLTALLMKMLLRVVAASFNLRRSFRKYLKTSEGWIDLTVGLRTESRSVECAIRFKDGRVSVEGNIPEKTDVTIVFRSDEVVKKLLAATPSDQIFMLLKSEMRVEGSIMYLNLFFFLLSVLMNKKQIQQLEKEKIISQENEVKKSPHARKELSDNFKARHATRLKGEKVDSGVKHLVDPYLPEFGLDDFPRLKKFLDIHFTVKPEVCPEMPRLLTEWHKKNGFETDAEGKPWEPITRKALSYKYLMENRAPIIARDYLIAGTTSSREVGCIVYPEGSGGLIWNELFTIPYRSYNPFGISEETRSLLHHDVFPYWVHRNFREWVRDKYDNPLCMQIDERYAYYFNWKQATISHTIPDFPKMLSLGTSGIIGEIREELKKTEGNTEKKATLEAIILTLEGLTAYSKNLAVQAIKDAAAQTDPVRKRELERLAEICTQVVENPARNLHEAVNAMWITWVGLHMESMNAGLSLGRLDQWLQPYFLADMQKITPQEDRAKYIKDAVELIGHFYMRCTDHFPLTPDLAN
ncbi:MAG TPA: pyruvate formate lyase family protein, partial [Smithellaceae bacterium]|nr:pyruvate formate lyase family protein [Smithellaceae bacterium]